MPCSRSSGPRADHGCFTSLLVRRKVASHTGKRRREKYRCCKERVDNGDLDADRKEWRQQTCWRVGSGGGAGEGGRGGRGGGGDGGGNGREVLAKAMGVVGDGGDGR